MSRIIKRHWSHIRLVFTLLLLVSGCLLISTAFGRQRHGHAARRVAPPVPNGSVGPTYVTGNFTFATPQELARPPIMATPGVTLLDQDIEPEIKVDLAGNVYVTAIHGVPGGVDLWKSKDLGANFVYLGEPDGAEDKCGVQGKLPCTAGAGGGDDSIDVSPGGYLYVSSLYLADITMSASYDGGTGGAQPGQKWEVNPAAGPIPSDDRQWVAAYGPQTVGMSYNSTALTRPPGGFGLFFTKSTDGGKTFGPAVEITDTTALDETNVEGNLVVDPYTGNFYTSYIPLGQDNVIRVAASTDGGATWKVTTAYTGPAGTTNRGVFPILAVDRGGALHLAFTRSNAADHTNCHVFLTSTPNPADVTPGWSGAVQIDHGSDNVSACLPWIVAGSPGIVDVTWLGSTAASPDAVGSPWHVFFAQVTGAGGATPTIAQNQVESAVMHNHSICFQGGACDNTGGPPDGDPGNRDLAEYYTMALDPAGHANIAYSDSVNGTCATETNCTAKTWYTKQTAGSSAYAPPTPPLLASFGTNVNVAANGGGGAEPNSETDSHNCMFSAAPGDPDFWKSINNGASFLAPVNPVADENGLTGGDEDILSVPQVGGARPDGLYFVDLGITSVHVRKSTDGGASWFAPGPGGAAGEVSVSSDRMWLDFDRDVPAAGDQTVYLMDHEFTSEAIRFSALTNDTAWSPFATAMTDPELFNPATSTFPNTNPGPAFVDQTSHLVYGVFNASTLRNNAANPPFGKMPNVWLVAGAPPVAPGQPPGPFESTAQCPNCGNYPAFKGVFDSPTTPPPPAGSETIGNNCSNDFPSGTIDKAGNIYVVWAMNDSRLNHFNVWMATSHDHGRNFYGPFQVSSGPGHALMPWIAAGDGGRVDIVYYRTTDTEDPNTSATDQWHVMFSQSLNAADREPVFTTVEASDHVNHIGQICNQGLLCPDGTRNLLDFFQVAIGPDGLGNIVYADDNNSGKNVHPEFVRQSGGDVALETPALNVTCLQSTSIVPLSVVSRKTHGTFGTYDITLPLIGSPGIECRKGGGADKGDHTIVFSFAQPITSVGGRSVDSSDGMATADPPIVNQQLVTVNLHHVTNAQTITLHLTAVSDGPDTGDVAVPMTVLLGDVDASNPPHVDAGDIGAVQNTNSQNVTASNFRSDVDVSGHIDAGDIATIQETNSTSPRSNPR